MSIPSDLQNFSRSYGNMSIVVRNRQLKAGYVTSLVASDKLLYPLSLSPWSVKQKQFVVCKALAGHPHLRRHHPDLGLCQRAKEVGILRVPPEGEGS